MTLKEWLNYGREMGYVRTSKDNHSPVNATAGKPPSKSERKLMLDKRRLMGYSD